MKRFASSFVILLVACGARTSPPDGTAALDASTEGGGPRPELDGLFMQSVVGDCIDYEEWIELHSPTSASQTFVDRNFCGPHSVHHANGTLSIAKDRVVRLSFTNDLETVTSSRTAIVLDPAPPSFLGPELQPGDVTYVYGHRAFVPYAFARTEGNDYGRTDETIRKSNGSTPNETRTSVTTTLVVTPGPALAKAGDPCTLHVRLVGASSHAPDPSPKTVTVDIACIYDTDSGSSWLAVMPKGVASSDVASFWYKTLEAKGVFALGQTGDAIHAAFKPYLLVIPALPDVLVMPRAAYREMLAPPPTSVK